MLAHKRLIFQTFPSFSNWPTAIGNHCAGAKFRYLFALQFNALAANQFKIMTADGQEGARGA